MRMGGLRDWRAKRPGIAGFLLLYASMAGTGLAAVCQPGFARGPLFPPGWNAGTSALADFNGDGALDLTTGVSVLLGGGDGSFGEAVTLPKLSGIPFDVIPADFDKDGHLDLAVTYFTSKESLGILYGLASDGPEAPLFEAPQGVPTVPAAWHIAVADFNEDSWLDIATIAYPGARSVGIHLYQGNRTFGFERAGPTVNPSGLFMATGDFDGDLHQDIAVGIDWEMGILFGRGDGTFDGSIEWELAAYGVPISCHRCRAADLDQDGRSELLVIGETFLLMYDGSTLGRDTEGPDTPSAIVDLEFTGRYLELADMNGDGLLDVVAQGARGRTVIQILWGLRGSAEGSYETATGTPIYPAIAGSGSVIAVGDVNGDRALDIVVTAEGSPSGQVLLNSDACQPSSAEPGDANGDGSVNLADAIVILAHLFHRAYLPCPGAAHLTEHEKLNIADAVYLLRFLFADGPPPPASGPRDCAL